MITIRDSWMTKVIFEHKHPQQPEEVKSLGEVRATIREIEGHSNYLERAIGRCGSLLSQFGAPPSFMMDHQPFGTNDRLVDALVTQGRISASDGRVLQGQIEVEYRNEQALLKAWKAREAELNGPQPPSPTEENSEWEERP
jgi:hypothetical protein